ncbi:MAG: hypothetical protein NTX15_01650 [Candidatus Kapabacteria bacterium]|nr:hypothetical protein [Candidatus Kapabacteria bacterium]
MSKYVYTTNNQTGSVTVTSGSNPTGKILLNQYQLTVYSSTPAIVQGTSLYYASGSALTVEDATSLMPHSPDPNWGFEFNVSCDQSVQVSQVPEP